MDQESAMFVNDCHEILSHRMEKLLVLTAEDTPYLHLLSARKYDRLQKGKGQAKESMRVLDVLDERGTVPTLSHSESKKRKSPSASQASQPISDNVVETATALFSPLPTHVTNIHAASTSAMKASRSSMEASPHSHIEETGGEANTAVISPSVSFHEAITSTIPTRPQVSVPSSPMKTQQAVPSMSMPRSPSFMRQRSYTFSTAADFAPASFFPPIPNTNKPIDPLAWLAAIAMEAEAEVEATGSSSSGDGSDGERRGDEGEHRVKDTMDASSEEEGSEEEEGGSEDEDGGDLEGEGEKAKGWVSYLTAASAALSPTRKVILPFLFLLHAFDV
jgi:hypothetical protein